MKHCICGKPSGKFMFCSNLCGINNRLKLTSKKIHVYSNGKKALESRNQRKNKGTSYSPSVKAKEKSVISMGCISS